MASIDMSSGDPYPSPEKGAHETKLVGRNKTMFSLQSTITILTLPLGMPLLRARILLWHRTNGDGGDKDIVEVALGQDDPAVAIAQLTPAEDSRRDAPEDTVSVWMAGTLVHSSSLIVGGQLARKGRIQLRRQPGWPAVVYGDTVRVAPSEVSFINPDCVKDIYQRRPRGGGFKSLPKDPICQAPPRPWQPISILDARDADHTRLHKAYAAAFSNQALTALEPLVTGYVEKMIIQLRSQTTSPTQGIDIQEWISFCTFDIICKLSFGEDVGCLDNQRYHEWPPVAFTPGCSTTSSSASPSPRGPLWLSTKPWLRRK
ncbi:hypothetical protein BDV41DRAFT_578200 [Aspergillus transmontanensis]|uniref:Cytochrome P450 n=1 Tax=Aspergillus transmontanensis TaxID=1034304 RepID=A0A5N6VTU9_9EURO|nr:hypothetical protein BDV41DRAFT_578200 [Aspergillus transmontanensis]